MQALIRNRRNRVIRIVARATRVRWRRQATRGFPVLSLPPAIFPEFQGKRCMESSCSINGIGHADLTRTVSTSLTCHLSLSLYSTARGDCINDKAMRSVRTLVEVAL